MKTLKLVFPILLLLIIVACKKKEVAKPKKEEEPAMDVSQYFIVGDYTFVLGGKPFVHPILLTFDEGGKTDIYDFAAVGKGQYSYTFSDNTITADYGGLSNWVFKINEGNIVSTSGIPATMKNFKLYKVPATNQFNGNVFSGVLSARETGLVIPYKYVFNETQFGESIIEQPRLTYAYSAIKNVAATTVIDRVIRYFLILDGKLFVSRYDLNTDMPARFFYGTLSVDKE